MNKNLSVIADEPRIDFKHLTRIEYKGQLVLTTAQLAEFYDTNVINLQRNFSNNAKYFVEGKHYFKLEGAELDILRRKLFQPQISPKTRVLYLWTKRGAARHCKSVGTDEAWNMFELLEDAYFSGQPAQDKPLKNITDFERGKEIARLARSARDPYIKNKLVTKAANLMLGEGFLPVDNTTQMVLDFGK